MVVSLPKVGADQRYTRNSPCPVCGGHRDLPRGQGVRCYGFTSGDGYAHCTREEYAGQLPQEDAGTYPHRLTGSCRCGGTHGAAPPAPGPAPHSRQPTSQPPRPRPRPPETVITYHYTDAAGAVLFKVDRLADKQFLQWHDHPEHAYGVWGRGDTPRVLFQLPRVVTAVAAGEMIHIAEGEKDVLAIQQVGGVATCNPEGALTWPGVDDAPLSGARVTIIQDKDTPGRKHAAQVVDSLRTIAASIRLVEARAGKDASDHLDAGHGLDAFVDVPLPEEPASERPRTIGGGEWILDAPMEVPSLWGDGDRVLHAQGEAFIICGPDGVGKTTLAQQYVLARLGLRESLLGMPVRPATGKVLYLAADRPQQAARSFRRMVTEADRAVLDERLVVHQGPLPFLITDDPNLLSQFVLELGCTDVVIDALKDVALDIADDAMGSRINLALQICIRDGLEVVLLHHQRKAEAQNKTPRKLADVYGSRWITAGAGSVAMVWGEAGDPYVQLRHLKQPAADVGPLNLLHDHNSGATTLVEDVDPLELMAHSGRHGLTATAFAVVLYGKADPSRSEVEKARRRLKGLARKGLAIEQDAPADGSSGKAEARYHRAAPLFREAQNDESRIESRQSRDSFHNPNHGGNGSITKLGPPDGEMNHGSNHANHAGGVEDQITAPLPSPLKGGGGRDPAKLPSEGWEEL